MRKTTRGWIFDSSAGPSGVRLWLLGEDGRSHPLLDPWFPVVRVAARGAAGRRAEALMRSRGALVSAASRVELFSGEVLALWEARLPPREQAALTGALKDAEAEVYDADINPLQAWHYERGHFPLAFGDFAEEDGVLRGAELAGGRWDADYALPPLNVMRLRLAGSATAGKVDPNHAPRGSLLVESDGRVSELDGPLELQLETLAARLAREDPDVLETEWGDSWLLPALAEASERLRVPLPLSREEGHRLKARGGRSFYTYGRAVYQNGSVTLRGRWHLDARNSFMLRECGMDGLLEVARLAALPVQRAARSTIGTALSSMQMLQAAVDGILIPSAKAQTEDFRPADEFLAADKGGLVYEPETGWHGECAEVDFASMYPTLMVEKNISPETVNCPCCKDNVVPGTGHWLCRRRPGLVPKVLAPLLPRRARYKALAKTDHPLREAYKRRAAAHKWILVCCFEGGTLFSYREDGVAKTGAIGELVDRHMGGRLGAAGPRAPIEAVGTDGAHRARWRTVSRLVRLPAPPVMLEVAVAGGRALTLTPDHTCFVLEKDALSPRRADALRPGDLVPLMRRLPVGAADKPAFGGRTSASGQLLSTTVDRLSSDLVFREIESVAPRAPRTPYVYCFELDAEPRLLAAANGLVTSNCFGYLGYSNARFGKIEAHECVTAWGREVLLRAKEAAEALGYRMLHALVDSVWVEGRPRADYEELRRFTEERSGCPLALEGVYKWLRFCPSKQDPLMGVPARYFGAFADGTLKARGLAYRRRDTPLFIKKMQEEMLALLAAAPDLEGCRKLVGPLKALVEGYRARLRDGQVSAEDLAVTVHLSRDPSSYKHDTHSALAAKALQRAGLTLHPGETLRYVIASAKDPVKDWRVTPLALLEGALEYDPKKYLQLLDRAAREILDGLDDPPRQLSLL